MKVFINPGHDTKYDPGACNRNTGLHEADVAANVGELVKGYLEAVGYEVQLLQSDNLYYDSDYYDRPIPVCEAANDWGADIFVSIHCNACNGIAQGTEVECSRFYSEGSRLAQDIQDQIVDSLGTVDRGVKAMPGLCVIKHIDMPAVLVEMAFIDNAEDEQLLANRQDDFARAIARGISDYTAGK